jgi:hypothetical protein
MTYERKQENSHSSSISLYVYIKCENLNPFQEEGKWLPATIFTKQSTPN